MATSRPPTPPCVLIIEDDPILMLSLVDFVEQAGCEAVEADNVVDALHLLETRPDIRTVFSDLDARNAEAGVRLALAIRDRWPPIELLMISSQPWRAEQLPTRGVILSKPFDSRKIVAALRKFTAPH